LLEQIRHDFLLGTGAQVAARSTTSVPLFGCFERTRGFGIVAIA